MAPPLLYPPVQLPPAAALALSQQAPVVLKSYPSTASSSPLSTLLSGSEKSEQWIQYENLVLSCLRTGDDEAAHECLRRLVARFGDDNERVQALRGLMKEAEAKGNGELEEVLKQYNQILGENDTNIVRPGHSRSVAYQGTSG
jgi:ER membrane protein complex subunit 2